MNRLQQHVWAVVGALACLVPSAAWAQTATVNGKRIYKVTWTATDKYAPEKPANVVRLSRNDGYWVLEPSDDGKTTNVTYYVYTDPGGAIPKFIKNRANSSAVPDVFAAVRKKAAAGK